MKTAYNVNPKMLNNLLDDVFGTEGLVQKGWQHVEKNFGKMPPVNITKSAKAYQLDLLVAGIPKDLLAIEIKDQILSVSFEYKESLEDGVQVLKTEFGKTSFERKFKLDDKIDVKNVSAQHENGILSLVLPLREELQPVQMKISIG